MRVTNDSEEPTSQFDLKSLALAYAEGRRRSDGAWTMAIILNRPTLLNQWIRSSMRVGKSLPVDTGSHSHVTQADRDKPVGCRPKRFDHQERQPCGAFNSSTTEAAQRLEPAFHLGSVFMLR